MLAQNVEENLRFLAREVVKQLDRTQAYVRKPERGLRRSLRGRDSYVDNLRTFIQRGCFEQAAVRSDIEYLTAIDIIAVNLERIADFCVDVVDQLDHLEDRRWWDAERFAPFFEEVRRALVQVEEAALGRDVNVALSVCRAEPRLDNLYRQAFHGGVDAMEAAGQVHPQVTLLFIWHYFERMGDSLLNIGEAVISASLGEKIKIGQLWALEGSLGDVEPGKTLDEVALEPLGESRSGCHVARVRGREPTDDDGTVIFKEGARDKLLQEREGIEMWESLVPGVAPRVYSFHEDGRSAALLLEYLPGSTFENVLLNGNAAELRTALEGFMRTLSSVWSKTLIREPGVSDFGRQLRSRLDDVFAIHPHFRGTRSEFGAIDVDSFTELVDRAASLETSLRRTFSVLVHGDMNVDNIINDADSPFVRLIDLHRSVMGDYVQDASVFLVSNFRLQIFDAPVRRRISEVTRRFEEMAREFAARSGDETFGARMTLGLARSLATSSRFVLDEEFAKAMFLRSRYLLERFCSTPTAEWSHMEAPGEVLLD